MKGIITKTVVALCGVAGLATAPGCVHHKDLVDPCWPERYSYMARQEVNGAMAPQVHNGHILDQTVWNYHFETGSDKLTPGGWDKLMYIARRRPGPDPMVYLQTAQDVTFEAANPSKLSTMRSELDNKRIQAVQSFLGAYTAGRGLTFQVAVHDPGEVGMSGNQMLPAILRMQGSSQGSLGFSLSGGAGAGAANVSGGAGAP